MALQAWHDTSADSSPLDYLQLFQEARRREAGNIRQATNGLLLEALEILALEHKAEADFLRRRFLDGAMIHTMANHLNVAESTTYRKQQEAIKRLAAVMQGREAEVNQVHQAGLEKRLHLPPEVRLFGVADHLTYLQTQVLGSEPIWLIAIEGLGGIGKTALANALVRRPELHNRFQQMAWVSAKQHEFLPDLERDRLSTAALTGEALIDQLLEQLAADISLTQSPARKQAALARLLKAAPHLIVIDNLETVVDYQALLPLLRDLANPSKFILTSRHSLRTQTDVFCCSLAELSHSDTLRLIRHEATTRGLPFIAQAADTDLAQIYEVVGGNPLALKLVVGQLSFLSLAQVLDSLKQARGKKIGALYSFIYWQTWQMLKADSRQLLLVMPLAQDGVLAHLLALSQLDVDAVGDALEQLVALSLVQVGGDLNERRYSIHRLTETFLLKEAIQWQASL